MSKSTGWLILERGAIVAGLLGLAGLVAFPMLSKLRCKGPASRSLNNVKQLATSLMMYSLDHYERLPGWVRNPDGRYAHNVWDQQIRVQVKSKDVYWMPQDGPGIRSYSDPARARVLSYAMNGLLITRPKRAFDGRADFDARPNPMSLGTVADPARTILFAEIATKEPMPAPFGAKPDPAPEVFGSASAADTTDWEQARDGWIDISPRDYVENTPAPDCYDPSRWNADSGTARDVYRKARGGACAFMDGHVKFVLPLETVSDGTVPPERYWSATNPHNMWNPNAPRMASR